MKKDFASICNGGYLVVPARVLNAAEYGVSTGTERVIFFGFKKEALTVKALQELSKKVFRKNMIRIQSGHIILVKIRKILI